MEFSRLLALVIFSSYFLIIIILFCLILSSLPSPAKRNGTQIAVYTFGALALVSFVHTWYCELRRDVLSAEISLMMSDMFGYMSVGLDHSPCRL